MTETIEAVLLKHAWRLPAGAWGPLAAAEWEGESFTAVEVQDWIKVRCWSADAAAFLRHHGAGPKASLIEVAPGDCLGAALSRGEIDSLAALDLIDGWRRARRPGKPPKDRTTLAHVVRGLEAATGAPVTATQVARAIGGSASSAAKRLRAAVRQGVVVRHDGARTYSARGEEG